MLKDITILRNGLISRRAKGLYWRNKKKRKLDIKHNDVNETNTIGKRK
jgi:ribosomal protein L19